MNDLGEIIFSAVLIALLLVIVVFIQGWLIYWLWNMSLPVIFGIKFITLKQGIVLSILANILFKTTTNIKNSN